jgi:hypothetical protein
VKQNIREPLAGKPGVVFATLAFRWFNWIPTGRRLINYRHTSGHRPVCGLLGSWDSSRAIAMLTEVWETEQVFTGAFTITAGGQSGSKLTIVCRQFIDPVWRTREALYANLAGASLATAHSHLTLLPGMGGSGFMAAQVIADLKHTHVFKDASDWWTWCSPGPGSRRGLNILLDLPLTTKLKKHQWDEEISRLHISTNDMLLIYGMPLVCAQDLQNCLCEFSKYERVREGGRSKRKYGGK